MWRAAIALSLLAALTTACDRNRGGGPEAVASPTGEVPSPTGEMESSAFPPYDQEDVLALSRPVRFRSADGVHLEGRLFGQGDVGIVLAHMGGGDQGQWWELAALLADRGYRALTYNRRGSCPSGGLGCSRGQDNEDGWKDVVAAVETLRADGAERVAVGGASLGAMESLYAVTRGEARADGLAWVAGADLYAGIPAARLVRRVHGPKLFMAGEFDDDFGDLAERLFRAATPPKELVLLDTGEHGTDIVAYEEARVADRFRRAVLALLATLD